MRAAFHRACLLSSLAVTTFTATQAAAQEQRPSDASPGLQEIIVTAQKKAENLQQTPLAVSAWPAPQRWSTGYVRDRRLWSSCWTDRSVA